MKTLTSIDPAATEVAIAWWWRKRLANVGTCPLDHLRAFRSDRAVFELPQVDGRGAPGDDLLRVAAAGAMFAAWCAPEVASYLPREWKGQVPKPIHHARMWAKLTPAERKILGGSQTHAAITAAAARGAKDHWRKGGARYYSAKDFPKVGGIKITHDILDAVALGLVDLGRLPKP